MALEAFRFADDVFYSASKAFVIRPVDDRKSCFSSFCFIERSSKGLLIQPERMDCLICVVSIRCAFLQSLSVDDLLRLVLGEGGIVHFARVSVNCAIMFESHQPCYTLQCGAGSMEKMKNTSSNEEVSSALHRGIDDLFDSREGALLKQ